MRITRVISKVFGLLLIFVYIGTMLALVLMALNQIAYALSQYH